MQHPDPDYSCVYVTIYTNINEFYGNGITFTLGRGTEVVVAAVNALKFVLEKRNLREIYSNFGSFWRELTNDSQMRWIGPDKGVTHLAVAAIINGLWDLWAKLWKLPVWRLLTDMDPKVSEVEGKEKPTRPVSLYTFSHNLLINLNLQSDIFKRTIYGSEQNLSSTTIGQ